MQNRNIKREEVIETLKKPEKIGKNSGNNLIAQRIYKDKLLRVVYRTEEADKIIITAYKTSKIDKYLID